MPASLVWRFVAMQGFVCKNVNVNIAHTNSTIGINSVGLVGPLVPMHLGDGYWRDGEDFTRYFGEKIAAFQETTCGGCSQSLNCIQREAFYYWLGKVRVPGFFGCPKGRMCTFDVYRNHKTWFSTIASLPTAGEANYSGVGHVQYRRPDAEKLQLTFTIHGPAKAQIYFNEARMLVNLYLLNAQAEQLLSLAQKLCVFDAYGVPEGLFMIKVVLDNAS